MITLRETEGKMIEGGWGGGGGGGAKTWQRTRTEPTEGNTTEQRTLAPRIQLT